MTDEELLQQLLDFFRGEGRFTAVKKYVGMAAGSEDQEFWPYFDSLSRADQERTVQLLAELEGGRLPHAFPKALQASHLLHMMSIRGRHDRLRGIQRSLEQDFCNPHNLDRWADAPDPDYITEDNYASSHHRAIVLYCILTDLGSKVAERSWHVLINATRSQRFRGLLHINRDMALEKPREYAGGYHDTSNPTFPRHLAFPSTGDRHVDAALIRDMLTDLQRRKMRHQNPDWLTASVLAVPPLARNRDFSLNEPENRKLIRHIEAGGVRTLLYGGNANLYHVPPSEYEPLLSFLAEAAGPDTLVIPSAGPAFGTMMDQAVVLRHHNKFPTAMVLPQVGITTSEGVASGVARFANSAGIPALLYIKHDGYIEPVDVKKLADDKLLSGIKYATVRADPADDEYLRRLLDVVDPRMVISGIGEQPAVVHMRRFALGGFTSGCVCVAPRLSARMLDAIRAQRWDEAERIRQLFRHLEDLRNEINPIRVLHEAVRLAGIADTGPLLPLLSNLPEADHPKVRDAARRLLAADT